MLPSVPGPGGARGPGGIRAAVEQGDLRHGAGGPGGPGQVGVQVRGCPSGAGLPPRAGEFLGPRVITPRNTHHDEGPSRGHRVPSLCSPGLCLVPERYARALPRSPPAALRRFLPPWLRGLWAVHTWDPTAWDPRGLARLDEHVFRFTPVAPGVGAPFLPRAEGHFAVCRAHIWFSGPLPAGAGAAPALGCCEELPRGRGPAIALETQLPVPCGVSRGGAAGPRLPEFSCGGATPPLSAVAAPSPGSSDVSVSSATLP